MSDPSCYLLYLQYLMLKSKIYAFPDFSSRYALQDMDNEAWKDSGRGDSEAETVIMIWG